MFADIGANIGWFTVLAANRFRELGAGRVVAFEPRSDLFKMLHRSVIENGLSSFATLYNVALSDQPGEMELAWYDNNAAASFLATTPAPPDAEREIVRVERLDDLDSPSEIRLIKSDAEGAEALLFSGGRGLLERSRPVIVAEFNIPRLPVVSGITADQFLAQMAALGYSCKLLNETGETGGTIASADHSPDPAANVVFTAEDDCRC